MFWRDRGCRAPVGGGGKTLDGPFGPGLLKLSGAGVVIRDEHKLGGGKEEKEDYETKAKRKGKFHRPHSRPYERKKGRTQQ